MMVFIGFGLLNIPACVKITYAGISIYDLQSIRGTN